MNEEPASGCVVAIPASYSEAAVAPTSPSLQGILIVAIIVVVVVVVDASRLGLDNSRQGLLGLLAAELGLASLLVLLGLLTLGY